MKAAVHSRCLDKAAAVAVAQPLQALSDCSDVQSRGSSSKSAVAVDVMVADGRDWQVIAGTAKPRFAGSGRADLAGNASQQQTSISGSKFRKTAKAIVEDVQRMLATAGTASIC